MTEQNIFDTIKILKKLGQDLQKEAQSYESTSTEFALLAYDAEILSLAAEILKKRNK